MQTDRKPFCYKLCPTGHKYYEEIIMSCESAFDAVFDFDCFVEKCYEKCPYHMIRDWSNPDGIEWWKLKNIEIHTYGKPDHPELIGDIMSIERYRDYIKKKLFIPYDGWGYYCTETEVLDEKSDYSVDLIDKKIKKGYKYVIWCNK